MSYLKKLIILISMLFFVGEVYALNYDLAKLVKKAAGGDIKSQKLLIGINKTDFYDELEEVFDYFFSIAKKEKNPIAQNIIGYMYYNDFGVKKDYKEALKWFLPAAKQDNPNAQFYVGFMHQIGLGGLKKDDAEALKWFLLSANNNNPYAQFAVGFMHERGLGGLKKDYKEALKWFMLADKGAPESNAKQKIQEIYDILKKLETGSFEN